MSAVVWRRAAVLAGLLALFAAGPASAQFNCRVTVQPVIFGNYVPADAAPLDVTGDVDIRCTGRPGIFLVSLSPGGSGNYAARSMLSGAFALAYNLYRDVARTLVWGDGTGGSVLHGGVKLRSGREDFSLPVYGRVPARQSVGSGVYADGLLVTIYF